MKNSSHNLLSRRFRILSILQAVAVCICIFLSVQYFGHETRNDKESAALILAAAKEMGLDEAEVRAMLSGKDFSDEVSLDEREAQLSRITSVPCFVINEKVAVPGAMPKDQFKDLIKKYFPGEVPTAI